MRKGSTVLAEETACSGLSSVWWNQSLIQKQDSPRFIVVLRYKYSYISLLYKMGNN